MYLIKKMISYISAVLNIRLTSVKTAFQYSNFYYDALRFLNLFIAKKWFFFSNNVKNLFLTLYESYGSTHKYY